MPDTKPDLSSVRSLITSVGELAKHVNLTTNGIYRWIQVNRIPSAHIIKVANFYDVELRDLLPLTGSEQSNSVAVRVKPRSALKFMLEVYRGNMSLKDACAQAGISEISGKLIL